MPRHSILLVPFPFQKGVPSLRTGYEFVEVETVQAGLGLKGLKLDLTGVMESPRTLARPKIVSLDSLARTLC